MRTIDADLLKEAFEMDGYKSPYVARMIAACPTVEAVPVNYHEQCMQMAVNRRIQAENAVPKWISLKEHPPTANGRYLVTDGVEVDIGFYFIDHAMFYDGDGAVVFVPLKSVTHWMELPKAHKGDKDE